MTLAITSHKGLVELTTSETIPTCIIPNWIIQLSNGTVGAYFSSFSSFDNFLFDSSQLTVVSYGDKALTQSYIENLIRLEDIENLKSNWNENGAPSFPTKQIAMMRWILSRLHNQPFITPTAKGSIQFEYEDDENNYLEFELFPDDKIKMFCYSANGETKTEYISSEEVSEKVDAFYKRMF